MRYAILALLITAAPPAITDNACYNIIDIDSRTASLAKVRSNPGKFYSVQSTEMRATCIAEVKGK